jgi:hypothetical protein
MSGESLNVREAFANVDFDEVFAGTALEGEFGDDSSVGETLGGFVGRHVGAWLGALLGAKVLTPALADDESGGGDADEDESTESESTEEDADSTDDEGGDES